MTASDMQVETTHLSPSLRHSLPSERDSPPTTPSPRTYQRQTRERPWRRSEGEKHCKKTAKPTVVTPCRSASSSSCSTLRTITSSASSSISTPSSPLPTTPHHIVYLIRHGQSKGQVVPTPQRCTDPSLLDCGLTKLGQEQAKCMGLNLPPMDLVVCSPLTRALETAVLAFPSHPRILIHYELRELGQRRLPENQPRPWNHVLADLPLPHNTIDTQSLAPAYPWPRYHDRTPNVLRRTHIQHVFPWLAQQYSHSRPQRIAVVCHFHVIRAAFTDPRGFCPAELRPDNAVPMPCLLTPEGHLVAIRN